MRLPAGGPYATLRDRFSGITLLALKPVAQEFGPPRTTLPILAAISPVYGANEAPQDRIRRDVGERHKILHDLNIALHASVRRCE